MGKAFVKAARVTVETNKWGGEVLGLRFFAMQPRKGPDGEPRLHGIARDEEDELRMFETFEAAERVVDAYNDGPEPAARAAKWSYVECAWEVTEWEPGSWRRGDREDFHSDG